MTSVTTLIERNSIFADGFGDADLPMIPRMRTVILTCVDARVDPAHVLGLTLGDAVVIRNNGGRVTKEVTDEIATLAFMVAMLDGDNPGPFELIIMHHTQCGAERFADPQFQSAVNTRLGIDVSLSAIVDHEESIKEDIDRLRHAPSLPDYVVGWGLIYDVKTGGLQRVVAPAPLRAKAAVGE